MGMTIPTRVWHRGRDQRVFRAVQGGRKAHPKTSSRPKPSAASSSSRSRRRSLRQSWDAALIPDVVWPQGLDRGIKPVCFWMPIMSSKLEEHIAKAVEFEVRSGSATDPELKVPYADLARSYRRLAEHYSESKNQGRPLSVVGCFLT